MHGDSGGDAEAQQIGSVHLKSQDTAPFLTFARRSCAVPEELPARRSTLARSANQQLTFVAAGLLMEDGETELARLFLYLLASGEHDFPESGISTTLQVAPSRNCDG